MLPDHSVFKRGLPARNTAGSKNSHAWKNDHFDHWSTNTYDNVAAARNDNLPTGRSLHLNLNEATTSREGGS